MQTDSLDEAQIEPKQKTTVHALLAYFDFFLVVSALTAFFHKSIFLGRTIGKLGLLGEIDALFNPALKNAVLSFRDPSGYLIFFPNGFFEEHFWSKFVVPLWNPYVACGYPLLGDPQSFIHSFEHFLGLYSSPEAYNYGLLLEILSGGIGMLMLGRFIKLSMAARVLSALAYVLSPRILVQVDISGLECFFPWIFLVFLWLAKRPSYLKAALAGLFSALCAYATHPESIFLAVLSAALLAFLKITFDGKPEANSSFETGKVSLRHFFKTLSRNTGAAFAYLLVSAFVALLTALPLILPFLQYMCQAAIYKDGHSAGVYSFSQFLLGFYGNIGHEPNFIGAVAAVLAPLGLISQRDRSLVLSLALTLGLASLIAMPPLALLPIFEQKPFSYLATSYIIPDVLLLLSVLSGLGLDELRKPWTPCKSITFWASLLMVVQFPINHLLLSGSAESISRIWKAGRLLLSCTSVPALAAAVFCPFVGKGPAFVRVIAQAALLFLNFLSLAFASRTALPAYPQFRLKAPVALAYLQKTQARCTATGAHFYLCNANQDFLIRDFRCFSPLLPERYLNYLKAAGAESHNLYFYDLPDVCSPLLDMASVKYVITGSALRSSKEDFRKFKKLQPSKLASLIPGLRLLKAEYYFDRQNSQLETKISWRIHDVCNYRYSFQFFITDDRGNEIWKKREYLIKPVRRESKHTHNEDFSLPVPLSSSLSNEGQRALGLRIKDTWTGVKLLPKTEELKLLDGFLLTTFSLRSKSDREVQPASLSHYRLAKEFVDSHCRVYENSRSLPEAYVAYNALLYSQEEAEEALALMQSPLFDPYSQVLLELSPEKAGPKKLKQAFPPSGARVLSSHLEPELHEKGAASRNPITPCVIKRLDCNTVLINCQAETDGFLVLTDSNYPGWSSYLDGKEVQIYQANYLFRAIELPKGKHEIRFVFQPPIYWLPLCVSLFSSALVLILTCLKHKEVFANEVET